MTNWSEDIFLERLMPLIQGNDPAQRGRCPGPELLCAFSEDRILGVEKKAIDAHLAGCARCRELHSRLVSFATPAAREDDREWTNAEKRLVNWMEHLLRTQEREHPDSPSQRELDGGTHGKNWWSAWQTQWAVGAVAAAALAVLAVLLLRPSPKVPRALETAQATLPASSDQTANSTSAAPQTETNTSSKTIASPAPGDQSTGEKSVRPRAGEIHQPQPARSKPALMADTPPIVAEAKAPNPTEFSGNPSSTGRETRPTAAPSGSGLADQSTRAVADSNLASPSPSKQASSRPAVYGYAPIAPRSTTKVTSPPPPNLPASIRLEAGTRIWVRISSLVRKPDGTLKFEGTLFEPVTQKGQVVLIQGTGVSGFEKQSQGSTLLVITDLSPSGTRYTLMGAAVMKDTLSRGGGKALQFNAGQLIEMFIESAAVYEKVPDTTGQPVSR